MTTRHLPVDTWMVVEQEAAWKHLALVSRHETPLPKRSGIEGTAVPENDLIAPV
jgi:hypothetical protein